jgi:cell fate regulator YaaT (PSP1 superfamily)
MVQVINVKYKNRGKAYYFSPNGYELTRGDHVIVDTVKGPEYAICTSGVLEIEDDNLPAALRPVIKPADAADRALYEKFRSEERETLQACKRKVAEHGLEMKLIDVDFSFDGTKLTFYFTADGRVDFRELVRDLGATFHKRIELRQIGIRDGAKMLGGLGPCGRETCCGTFQQEFQAISVKMAKNQGLSLNPVKISGVCGNLMCCLKHEEEVYNELSKDAPALESVVDTPIGKGLVVDVNLLRRIAKVRVVTANETVLKSYPLTQLGYTVNGEYREPTEEPALFEKAPAFEPPKYEPVAEPAVVAREVTVEHGVPNNQNNNKRNNNNRNRGRVNTPNQNSQNKQNTRPNTIRPQQNKPVPKAANAAKINIAEIASAAVTAAVNASNAQNGFGNAETQKRGNNRNRNYRNRNKRKDGGQ